METALWEIGTSSGVAVVVVFIKWLDENMMYIHICDVLWETISWYVFNASCLHFPLMNLCRLLTYISCSL